MYAFSLSPTGMLAAIPVDAPYRLGLMAVGPYLGIGVQFPMGSMVPNGFLAAIDTGAKGGEPDTIAARGFPKDTKAANIERLQEAMKILYNSQELKPAAVEGFIGSCPALVDVYYEAMAAVISGGEAKGICLGWKWYIGPKATGWGWAQLAGKQAQE